MTFKALSKSSAPISEAGFILPGVLAFVAAFTFILLTTAMTLERSRGLAVALERQQSLAGALDAAEAQATYLFLTARPVPDGLLLYPEAQSAVDIVLGTETETPEVERKVWNADGGILLFANAPYRTWAIYRDTAGLVSLTTGSADMIGRLLEDFDVSSNTAATLAARLKDYQDEDRVRRPLGAERADYRLRQRPSPSDSPLRSISELGRIYGWEELTFINDLEFLAQVTSSFGSDRPIPRFATDRLRILMAEMPGRDMTQLDILTQASNLRSVPSDRARLVLIAQDTESGESIVRLIEIERKPSAAAAPYTKALVAEFTDPNLPQNWLPREDAQITVSP